jgi:hypothetical protein
MEKTSYLEDFQQMATALKSELLTHQLEVAAVTYGDCAVLKLYRASWANPLQDPLTAETRIFFSVWTKDWTKEQPLKEQKLFYNIHALKLRKLRGYAIESKKFADAFRKGFRRFAHHWPNVRMDFGPLTLMEGWVETDTESLSRQTLGLARNFPEIAPLIDNTLAAFKR